MITVGLDLSLAKTGITILKDGEVVHSSLIKSKPSGDKPIDELRRLIKIVDEIESVVLGIGRPDVISIENLAFMARNTTALTQLSGLNYLVREMLLDNEIPFLMVAPTSLKKFITGRGNADKNQMMMQVFKEYGFESLDDNICDSYSLAVLSMAVLDKPIKKNTKPQEEVVKLIKSQLHE